MKTFTIDDFNLTHKEHTVDGGEPTFEYVIKSVVDNGDTITFNIVTKEGWCCEQFPGYVEQLEEAGVEDAWNLTINFSMNVSLKIKKTDSNSFEFNTCDNPDDLDRLESFEYTLSEFSLDIDNSLRNQLNNCEEFDEKELKNLIDDWYSKYEDTSEDIYGVLSYFNITSK